MCTKSLFFYSNYLESGPPEKTCLQIFLSEMSDKVLDFSITLLITASFESLLLVLACCMIVRNRQEQYQETLTQY